MSNKGIKNLMIVKHGNRCWLNYKLTKNNQLTYHHIKAARDGGKATEDNGALLSKMAHEDFNKLEQRFPELAEEINYYLKNYKGNYPKEVAERINQLLSLIPYEGKPKTKKQKLKR